MAAQSDTPAVNPAEIPVYEARTLYQVPFDRVREDPDQPRKSFDAIGLEEMVASVARNAAPEVTYGGIDHRPHVLRREALCCLLLPESLILFPRRL
jgi:hypothetical protein